MPAKTKICSTCGEEKPIHQFCKNKQSADGLSYRCYDCRHARYVANRQKIRKKITGPEHRTYRQVANNRQRAKQYDVENTLTLKEWLKILNESNGYCAYCKQKVGSQKLVIDHVIPITEGGGNSKDNIVAACTECNLQKGNRSVEVFLKEIQACKIEPGDIVIITGKAKVQAVGRRSDRLIGLDLLNQNPDGSYPTILVELPHKEL